MKFAIFFAAFIALAQANLDYGLGYGHGYGHVIPPRIDIAPGGVETYYTQKVVAQPIVTKYSTPIVAPVVAKVSTPILGKVLAPVKVAYPAPVAHYGGHGY